MNYERRREDGSRELYIADQGDGTAVQTTYDVDGTSVLATETIEWEVEAPAVEPAAVVDPRPAMLAAYEAEMAGGTRSLARIDAALRAALAVQ